MTVRVLPVRPSRAIEHVRRVDPVLRPVIKAVGPLPLDPHPADFQAVCHCIIGQQLSIIAAAAIRRRFDALVSPTGRRARPADIARHADEELRKSGLSGAKVRALRSLCELWGSGGRTDEELHTLSDDGVIEALSAVKGIGPWTAKMFLIFALRRADVMPHEDLGFRAGLKQLYGLRDLPDPEECERLSESWRPWRTVGTLYVWESLNLAKARN